MVGWPTFSSVSCTPQHAFRPSPTWLKLNATAVKLLLAATLLIGLVSLFAMATGDPETMALVGLTGIAVVLFGTAAVRFSERLRTTELARP